MSYLSKCSFHLQAHPHWIISSCIHHSMAMKAGLAFAFFSWAQRAPFQSFLAVRSGFCGVPAQGQSRFAGQNKMNRRTRTCTFSPCSGDVRVSNSCVVRKSVFSGHVKRGLQAVLAASAGQYHTCAVRSDGQLVCFGSNTYGQCDVPADLGPVWRSQREVTILVQCGQMVSSSALDTKAMDVTSQLIWDQFWRSQRASTILVQCG